MSEITLLILPNTSDQSIVELHVGDVVQIGRSTSDPPAGMKKLHLPFPEVSGTHARIRCTEANIILVDPGSTNGTTVNDIQCQSNVEYPLWHGDCVRFAGYLIRVEAPKFRSPAQESDQFARQLSLKAMPRVELPDFEEVKVFSDEDMPTDLGTGTVIMEPVDKSRKESE